MKLPISPAPAIAKFLKPDMPWYGVCVIDVEAFRIPSPLFNFVRPFHFGRLGLLFEGVGDVERVLSLDEQARIAMSAQ